MYMIITTRENLPHNNNNNIHKVSDYERFELLKVDCVFVISVMRDGDFKFRPIRM